jgi:Baseplate J-like protein
MPNILDANGLQTQTQAELLAYYTAAYQLIYGADISLDTSTPDGQWMNIQIQAVLDVLNLLTQIYNSFDPDNAIGVVLDQRVAINGIQREGGTYTVTNVTLVISQSINLYGLDQSINPVYTVADAAGNQWELIATVLGVTAGSHIFAFQAAKPGAVLSIPNTITVPVTIVLGVTSINNPTTYTTLGINTESDAALKVRRQNSVSNSSQGFLQGLLGTLENINGVTSAFVYENDSDTTDGDGVPGHSIWVIIAGTPAIPVATAWSSLVTYAYGQIVSSGGINYISWKNNNLGNVVTNTLFWGVYNPVAQAIYAKRNAGCGMFGATDYTVTQIDGTQFIVSYDSVISVPLFIKFTATSLDGVNPPNLAAILSQLPVIYTPGVHAEVNINQLACLVQQIDPNTLVTNSGFSLSAGGSYTNTLTPVSKQDQFVVSSADTIILSIILASPISTYTIVAGVVTHTNEMIVNGNTIQFGALGGYGTYTYSISVNNSGGTINSASGLYTAGATPGIDTILVTDSLSNTGTSLVTVT